MSGTHELGRTKAGLYECNSLKIKDFFVDADMTFWHTRDMGNVLFIDFKTKGATTVMKAAAASRATVHPTMAGLVDDIDPKTRGHVDSIVSQGMRDGATIGQLVKSLVDVGLDRRTAKTIARTGSAVIAARARI